MRIFPRRGAKIAYVYSILTLASANQLVRSVAKPRSSPQVLSAIGHCSPSPYISYLLVEMVNPGGFQGLRKKFLDDQQDFYAAAVKDKHIADGVADIQRRYFKRFPLTLSHTEEPTDEFLATVDDNAPDPELCAPEKGTLSDEAYARACRVYEFQVKELTMRKAVSTPS